MTTLGNRPNTALLVVDVQYGVVEGAYERDAVVANVGSLVEKARRSGLVVTHGLGPRYLHSTGQLHKGGPPTGLFLQVVDDVHALEGTAAEAETCSTAGETRGPTAPAALNSSFRSTTPSG